MDLSAAARFVRASVLRGGPSRDRPEVIAHHLERLEARTVAAARLPVAPGLQLERFGIQTAGPHQLGVGAMLSHRARLEPDDQVGHAHRGEPEGHQHRDPTRPFRGAVAAWTKRSNSAASVRTSSEAVGSSRTFRRGVWRIMARPNASYCHWPPDSSAPWPDRLAS